MWLWRCSGSWEDLYDTYSSEGKPGSRGAAVGGYSPLSGAALSRRNRELSNPAGAAVAILFVDDDTTGRMAAAYHLRRAGFEVDETADGEAALGRFDPLRHALVITDLRMPGGGGAPYP